MLQGRHLVVTPAGPALTVEPAVADLLQAHLRVSAAECQCGARFGPNRRLYVEHLAAVLETAGWLRPAPIQTHGGRGMRT